jgi:hypothetical protein
VGNVGNVGKMGKMGNVGKWEKKWENGQCGKNGNVGNVGNVGKMGKMGIFPIGIFKKLNIPIRNFKNGPIYYRSNLLSVQVKKKTKNEIFFFS